MKMMTITIGDLCDEDRHGIDASAADFSTLRYLSMEHVEADTGRIIYNGDGSRLGDGESNCFRFDQRHVLYGKLRPYLNKVALPEFTGRCSTELVPLLPREGVCRDLVAILLRKPQTVAAAMKERTGARMPRARMQDLLGMTVTVPESPTDQLRLVNEHADQEQIVRRGLAVCASQAEALRAFRQALLANFGETKGKHNGEIQRIDGTVRQRTRKANHREVGLYHGSE